MNFSVFKETFSFIKRLILFFLFVIKLPVDCTECHRIMFFVFVFQSGMLHRPDGMEKSHDMFCISLLSLLQRQNLVFFFFHKAAG